MKYSRNDFSFLLKSWSFRSLHGKTNERNSERDLYILIYNGPNSIFGLAQQGKYKQAAHKVPYILTLLLDELFNIDLELQQDLYKDEKDRQQAWNNWNDANISQKLNKLPWLDKYFGDSFVQKLFNSSKNSDKNSEEQNIAVIEGLLELIGGLYNIFEASPQTQAPVPVKGPSRTNLKSNEHKGDSPYSESFKPKSTHYSYNEHSYHQSSFPKRRDYRRNNDTYQNTDLDTIKSYIREIWDKYNNKQYYLALNPLRIITEDLIKRALLKENIISPSEAGSKGLSDCIKLFEDKVYSGNKFQKQNFSLKLGALRILGNNGSHAGLNRNDVSKRVLDDLLSDLSDVMQFLSQKFGNDFSVIYDYYHQLDQQYRAPKPKVVTKTKVITRTVPQPTPQYSNTEHHEPERREENHKRNKKHRFIPILVIAALIVLVVAAVNHQNNSDDDATANTETSRPVHHKKKHHKVAQAATSASSTQSSASSSSSQSSAQNTDNKPKVSKWVGTYKGTTNDGDDQLGLRINADGSVVYTVNDKDDGEGKATGYWVNKGNIGIKVYLTNYDNVDDVVQKEDMPLTINMSADKQEIFVKSDADGWTTDHYIRWEDRQHYNLPDSKWVGTYSGTSSNDTKTTIKIKPDGSVTFTDDDDDNGVGKGTGYWINGSHQIKVYLTHYDNLSGVDETDMPLLITMSSDHQQITVDSNNSDWTADHYDRK